MKETLDNRLVKALIDTLIFFEFADENIINLDAASEVIENIASELQLMDNNSKKNFIATVEVLIDQYNTEQQNFIKNLPVYLGLLSKS